MRGPRREGSPDVSGQAGPEPPAETVEIELAVPLDLRLTLRPFLSSRLDPTMHLEPGYAMRAWRTTDGPATLEVRHEGRVIRARAWGPGAAAAVAQVPALLGLDDRAADTFDAPALRPLRPRVAGLRIGRTGTLVDALVRAIVGQRVTVTAAQASLRALAAAHGEAAPGPGGMRTMPDAAGLLRLRTWEWHRLGLEDRRTTAIRRVADRADRIESLALDPPERVRELLCTIPGVGPWTVALATAFALGDTDAVPLGDMHIPGLVAWNLAGEARGDDARMLELLEPYRGQRWRVIRWLMAAGSEAPRFGARRALGPPPWK